MNRTANFIWILTLSFCHECAFSQNHFSEEKISKAEAFLTSGREAAKHNFSHKSIDDCKKGIELIGRPENYNQVVDDTGISLVLAQSLEQKSEASKAAAIYCNVLSSKIEIRKKYK